MWAMLSDRLVSSISGMQYVTMFQLQQLIRPQELNYFLVQSMFE